MGGSSFGVFNLYIWRKGEVLRFGEDYFICISLTNVYNIIAKK